MSNKWSSCFFDFKCSKTNFPSHAMSILPWLSPVLLYRAWSVSSIPYIPAASLQKELWLPVAPGVIIEPLILLAPVDPSIIQAAAPLSCWYEPSDTAIAWLFPMSSFIWSNIPHISSCICQSDTISDPKNLSLHPLSLLPVSFTICSKPVIIYLFLFGAINSTWRLLVTGGPVTG